jgi:hypothetical protein
MTSIAIDQVRALASRFETATDRNTVIRSKEICLSEDSFAKNIVFLNVDENLYVLLANPAATDEDLKAHYRLNAHTCAILRFKQNMEGTELPYSGKPVPASHAEIHQSGFNDSRVKIKRISDGVIHLEAPVSVRAGAEVRLMKIEKANTKIEAICRVCETMQWLPVFHGTNGICIECNTNLVVPAKIKLGCNLRWLEQEGMFFKEIRPKSRRFKADEVTFKGFDHNIYTIQLPNGEEVRCFQDSSGNYREETKPLCWPFSNFNPESMQTVDGDTRYLFEGNWYTIDMARWAKGLRTKLKDLRTDRSKWTPLAYDGLFNDDPTYGDKTLEHMRRVFNIAVGKRIAENLRPNKKNYEECVEHLKMIFDQPDCSRQLYEILKEKLDKICQVGNFHANLHAPWAQEVVTMYTAINNMQTNTAVQHA